MAVNNKIKYLSSWDANKSVGQDWFCGFLKRNLLLIQRTSNGFQELYINPHFADGTGVFNLVDSQFRSIKN